MSPFHDCPRANRSPVYLAANIIENSVSIQIPATAPMENQLHTTCRPPRRNRNRTNSLSLSISINFISLKYAMEPSDHPTSSDTLKIMELWWPLGVVRQPSRLDVEDVSPPLRAAIVRQIRRQWLSPPCPVKGRDLNSARASERAPGADAPGNARGGKGSGTCSFIKHRNPSS